MINAILIDDEFNALKNLKWEIERFCPNVKIIDSFTDPVEAISAINYLKPDCVFLDIEMPEMDGFQLLKALKYRHFDLIITTAYDNYAITAFRENAIDYLLKPIDSEDLQKAVARVESNIANKALGFEFKSVLDSIAPPITHRKIGLPLAGRTMFKDSGSIIFCKSDGNYCEVYFTDKTHELVTLKLKDMEQIIDLGNFYRVHNSYYINTNHILEYVRTSGPYLIMSNGTNIPVSRNKKEGLLQLLSS